MLTKPIILLTLCCVIVLTACRKQADRQLPATGTTDYGQGTGNCLIRHLTTHSLNSSGAWRVKEMYFEYYPDGRIKSAVDIGTNLLVYVSSSIFTYSGDTIFAKHEGGPFNIDTVILNAQKQVVRTIGRGALSGIYLRYDAAGNMVSLDDDVAPLEKFVWQGGDMVRDSVYQGSSSQNFYTYYTDRPFQLAGTDALGFYGTWGVPLYRTAHLQRTQGSFAGGGTPANYTFDAAGKIIADTTKNIAGQVVYYATYEYECR